VFERRRQLQVLSPVSGFTQVRTAVRAQAPCENTTALSGKEFVTV